MPSEQFVWWFHQIRLEILGNLALTIHIFNPWADLSWPIHFLLFSQVTLPCRYADVEDTELVYVSSIWSIRGCTVYTCPLCIWGDEGHAPKVRKEGAEGGAPRNCCLISSINNRLIKKSASPSWGGNSLRDVTSVLPVDNLRFKHYEETPQTPLQCNPKSLISTPPESLLLFLPPIPSLPKVNRAFARNTHFGKRDPKCCKMLLIKT